MACKHARRRKVAVAIMEPTASQIERDDYQLAPITERGQVIGTGFRKVRQLEKLLAQDMITPSEFHALHRYRLYADMSDRSLLKDSLAKQMPGGGKGEIPPYILDAKFRAGAIEAAAGTLAPMLRAVIVDDNSLSEWAIANVASYIACEIRKGKRLCRVKPTPKALQIAKLEIKMAARRVRAEIEA